MPVFFLVKSNLSEVQTTHYIYHVIATGTYIHIRAVNSVQKRHRDQVCYQYCGGGGEGLLPLLLTVFPTWNNPRSRDLHWWGGVFACIPPGPFQVRKAEWGGGGSRSCYFPCAMSQVICSLIPLSLWPCINFWVNRCIYFKETTTAQPPFHIWN